MAAGSTGVKRFIGVNFTDPPTEIGDNELVLARNCWPTKRGYIGARPLQSPVGTATGGADDEVVDRDNDATLFNFVDVNGKHQTVAFITTLGPANLTKTRQGKFVLGDSQFNFTTDIQRHDSSGVNWPEFGPMRPQGLVYNNELYIFLGHTVPGLVLGANDLTLGSTGGPKFRALGTTWAAFTSATAEQFKFNFGTVYRDIMVLGGLPPPYESLAFFTQGIDNLGDPQPAPHTLLTSAKSAAFGYGDGDKLLNLVTTPILGGAAAVEPYVLAFKQRSVWLAQGDVPTTTDDGTLVVTPVMRREGLVASNAVCSTPYGIVWCSGRNVWLMPPGQKPTALGDKIKGFLETLPQTPAGAWHLTFHNDVLYLNFPSPDGWTGTPVGGGAPSLLATQQLWGDMSKFEEDGKVMWWGPMDVHASHMTALDYPDGARQLLGICAQIPGGILTHQPFSFEASRENGLDFSYDNLADFTFTGDGQVPRTSFQHVKFREMDFGDDGLEKLIDALEINASWDLAISVGEDPMVTGFIGNSGRKKVIAELADSVSTETAVANPDQGTARSATLAASDASNDFTGITWDPLLPPRKAAIFFEETWDGGAVTINGTNALGGPLSEDVTKSTPDGSSELHLTANYFRSIVEATKAIQGVSGDGAYLAEGDVYLTEYPATDPASTGFVLGQNTLGGVNDVNLSETFIPLVFFPPNSERFVCRTFQAQVYGGTAIRRFCIRSITPRIRPIGRRPGGSYGG